MVIAITAFLLASLVIAAIVVYHLKIRVVTLEIEVEILSEPEPPPPLAERVLPLHTRPLPDEPLAEFLPQLPSLP